MFFLIFFLQFFYIFFVFFVLTSFLTFNLLTLRLSFNSGKNHFFLFLWDKVWLRTPLRNGIRICFMKRKSYRPCSWNNIVKFWSWPYGPMVKILLFSLGSMSSNLAPCLPFMASVFYPTIPYPTILLDRSQNNISEQHWFYPISNHFAASTAKLSNRFIWSRRVKISYRCCFIQPVFRDIQPFGTIQTHIQPLLVYPTIFPNYPTVWIESKPYPTISGLSNHYPTV